MVEFHLSIEPSADLALCVQDAPEQALSIGMPFIAEGGIWSPEEARLAIECGAFAVVVGSAITRPQIITERYARAVEGK